MQRRLLQDHSRITPKPLQDYISKTREDHSKTNAKSFTHHASTTVQRPLQERRSKSDDSCKDSDLAAPIVMTVTRMASKSPRPRVTTVTRIPPSDKMAVARMATASLPKRRFLRFVDLEPPKRDDTSALHDLKLPTARTALRFAVRICTGLWQEHEPHETRKNGPRAMGRLQDASDSVARAGCQSPK